tara:strand:- start:296 stop:832 length:537 start_codon:yes stop_codon:yes gene_type:complete
MTITLKPTASETTIQNNGSDIFTVDSTGIAMASGKTITDDAPSFSARMTSSQTVPTTTFTKILFNVENWDTNSNYNTTLARFTPTVAGYYQFNASSFMGSGSGRVFTLLFKNGAVAKYGSNLATTVNGGITTAVNAQLEANGSSDYFECMLYQESGSNQTINADRTLSWFDGFLAKAA